MKLCVYCGTFNPIHNVHLAVANYVRTHFDFDNILFIPAYKPPHKDIDDELANHRYNMVKLAIQGVPKFNISNIEYRNDKFSYTYNTIKELYAMYPSIEGKIHFIIGTDAFKDIQNWYKAESLKSLLKFIIFPREEKVKIERYNYYKDLGYDFVFADMPYINLSSTVLRSRIRNNKPIGTLVPNTVMDYINKNGLYKDENNK